MVRNCSPQFRPLSMSVNHSFTLYQHNRWNRAMLSAQHAAMVGNTRDNLILQQRSEIKIMNQIFASCLLMKVLIKIQFKTKSVKLQSFKRRPGRTPQTHWLVTIQQVLKMVVPMSFAMYLYIFHFKETMDAILQTLGLQYETCVAIKLMYVCNI